MDRASFKVCGFILCDFKTKIRWGSLSVGVAMERYTHGDALPVELWKNYGFLTKRFESVNRFI